jgi:hypothetical protein
VNAAAPFLPSNPEIEAAIVERHPFGGFTPEE